MIALAEFYPNLGLLIQLDEKFYHYKCDDPSVMFKISKANGDESCLSDFEREELDQDSLKEFVAKGQIEAEKAWESIPEDQKNSIIESLERVVEH